MKNVVTLTLNPAIDKSTSVPRLVPEQKLRCDAPKVEPGGGGINVSRGLQRLGLSSRAVFTAGGPPGEVLQQLMTREGIAQCPVLTDSWTRENFTVVDASCNQQYRFGMPGSVLTETEQAQALATLAALSPAPDVLVASGSLPQGVAPEFMGKIARWARSVGAKLIVDTSDEALKCAVDEGVYLLKPNLGELSRLAGVEALDTESAAEAARSIIEAGKCEIVVVSLGPNGAYLVTREQEEHIPAPSVKKRSTVGAGDSMVAGMVFALCEGRPVREAVRMGVACGSAATMNSGTELFHKADAEKLFQWLLKRMPQTALAHL
ncbi:1-phosphofructokinase family hexose kinase [Hymenobacter sp. BT683]|uniref:1-phosphofructokinase family hexose kinase n=1 Tax=Hymenobacter jeongseonensis TaxID=2791027 RepID=A0ABS0IHA2_9BACT|nr:1-phosphofructokinase family hexose kinase [Hymenobacter jeongseonensis]MBF9237736.1 1-phosphofructokinase family hexose kinase [Hymenobacter jeongseonensis]